MRITYKFKRSSFIYKLLWLVAVALIIIMSMPDKAQSSPKTHEVRLTLNEKIVRVIEIKNPHLILTQNIPVLKGDYETPTIRPEETKVIKRAKPVVKARVVRHRAESRSFNYSHSSITEYARSLVVKRWGEGNWESAYKLINAESGFSPTVMNRSSGASGIAQKISGWSEDYSYGDYKEQLIWMCNYVQARYGSFNNAWAIWNSRYPHWY